MDGNPLFQVIRIKAGGRRLALGGRDSSSLGTALTKVKTSHKEDPEASVRRAQLPQLLSLCRDGGDAGSAIGSPEGPQLKGNSNLGGGSQLFTSGGFLLLSAWLRTNKQNKN